MTAITRSLITRSLPLAWREALTRVKGPLGLKVMGTETYRRQRSLAYGLTSGTLPHQRIGNYDAVEIGAGNLATVHLARDLMTGEFVALKRANDTLFEHTIEQEAKILQLLPSRKIVKYLGLVKEPHCLIKEFIFGAPVEALELTFPEKIYVIIGALKALKAIHKAGVLDPDIEPANVMISASGELVLPDFNLCEPTSNYPKPQKLAAAKRKDLFLAVRKMGSLFNRGQEQELSVVKLFPKHKLGESADLTFHYKSCDQFLMAIYAKLQTTI